MKYYYYTDSEAGHIEADTLDEAIKQVRPTDKQIEDGAWMRIFDEHDCLVASAGSR